MARPSPLDRLQSATDPIVLISGPAGAGKTTLVEAWARDEPRVRVLSLTRHHNTAESLLNAIFATTGTTASSRIAPEDVLRWAEQLGRVPFTPEHPGRLVLDGAETITDPEARLLLRDLVDHRPAALRLVVTTRHRRPDWLTRGLACGAATTITAEDLRLPSTKTGENVHDCAGWALAVTLVDRLGRAKAADAIRDFLRDEVLARVTTEVRHLLHAVSITPGTTPALAIHLTGNPAAGRLLAEFADTTQFATRTGNHTFRLHPQLARALTDELATEHWESYTALRRRYADWLAGQGRVDRSTRLYVELGDEDTANATLVAQWQRTVLSGHAELVDGALGCLPPLRLARDPRLCLISAMAHLAGGDCHGWQRWADVAEAIGGDAVLEPGVPVAAALAVSRRFARAVTDGTVSGEPCDAPPRGLWSALSAITEGLGSLWAGQYATATARFHRAEVEARVSGDRLALVHALSGLALTAALGGDDRALPHAGEAIAMAGELSPRCRWVAANAHLALATVHRSARARQDAIDAANDVLRAFEGVSSALGRRTRARATELLDDLHRAEVRNRRTPEPRLSSREQRVLRALCGPLTLREIAGELFVSHNTIKSQVNSIFRKLGVHDRAAAVAAARSRR
ncbi:LuxR C-terminal-related transcriptional regulator [Amycolatopsis mongoliensis]|uniref:LuxR C-terminal-related transcriptional regulator n=1 Tax=Amycolatopsis mongoliensis TaxID=715475 RepID=A0A9Y2JNL4_9PSEU|nr:LuxR C-terminal-related transcriptional regulator [Amycolatopsis sp. 4-36]WIY01000.1 LuxR C-terminal-related transcriptional regulator [Amycolatopsis sp. 4-36]